MFSKEESKNIRQQFWTSFGKEYPRKWLLYNTKIKEFQLKFTFDRKTAMVSLDIYDSDELVKAYYYEKLISLKQVLITEYLPDAIFEESYELPEGKTISRVYTEITGVSIHNQKDWALVKEFFAKKMDKLEEFFEDFSDYLKS